MGREVFSIYKFIAMSLYPINFKYWPSQTKGQLGSEEAFQISVATYLDYRLPPYSWYHCPNGGVRTANTGASLKRQGAKAGVPDVVIVSHKTVIELKAREQKPRPEQLSWLESHRSIGWRAYWVNSFDEFLALAKEIGL